MIRCDFVFGEDSEFGTDGWIPKANLDFNAMNGMGVAHDTMEHFNLGEGTLEEEFLAFGSMFYIRVEGGYFHNYTRSHLRPVDHLSSDLAKFSIEKFWQGNGLVLNDMTWRPRHLEFWENDLEELVQETMRLIRSEMDEPDYRVFRRVNPNFESLLKRWIRRGWNWNRPSVRVTWRALRAISDMPFLLLSSSSSVIIGT